MSLGGYTKIVMPPSTETKCVLLPFDWGGKFLETPVSVPEKNKVKTKQKQYLLEIFELNLWYRTFKHIFWECWKERKKRTYETWRWKMRKLSKEMASLCIMSSIRSIQWRLNVHSWTKCACCCTNALIHTYTHSSANAECLVNVSAQRAFRKGYFSFSSFCWATQSKDSTPLNPSLISTCQSSQLLVR